MEQGDRNESHKRVSDVPVVCSIYERDWLRARSQYYVNYELGIAAGSWCYTASKGGMPGVTRALALELAPHSITVNGISPGLFSTEMNTALIQKPEIFNDLTSRIPLGRSGNPEEIGQLAVYLSSPEAGFITGPTS